MLSQAAKARRRENRRRARRLAVALRAELRSRRQKGIIDSTLQSLVEEMERRAW